MYELAQPICLQFGLWDHPPLTICIFDFPSAVHVIGNETLADGLLKPDAGILVDRNATLYAISSYAKLFADSSVLVPSPPTIPQGEQLPRTPQSRVKSTRDHTISATKEINKPVILPKKFLSDTKNVSDILCFPQSILGKHIFEDFGDDDGNNELDELLEIRSMFDYADLALSESCSPPMNLDFLTSSSLGFDGSGPFAPLTDNKL